MSAKNNSTTSQAKKSPLYPRTQAETAKKIAREVAAYFSERRSNRDPVASALSDFIIHLLHDSPARAQFAYDLYRACARAFDTSREENGHRDGIYSIDPARENSTIRIHTALLDALLPAGVMTVSSSQARRHHKAVQEAGDQEQQIVGLRERLHRLNDSPTNEAMRFQLLTEIYRLENALNIEEWPDLIDG